VSLHGHTGGTGLDASVDLTVTRGVVRNGAFFSDERNHLGLGAGVVFQGTLRDFPDAPEAGLVDATRSARERWSPGESHAYRFDVSLASTNAAQGLTVVQSFTWRARAL
jgi:hypothetical protein